MAKEKPYEKKINAFYKKNSIDLMMFSWVTAVTKILPAVTRSQAIDMFMAWIELSEDDYPMNSAKITYSRIKQNFIWRKKDD